MGRVGQDFQEIYTWPESKTINVKPIQTRRVWVVIYLTRTEWVRINLSGLCVWQVGRVQSSSNREDSERNLSSGEKNILLEKVEKKKIAIYLTRVREICVFFLL